MSGSSIMQASTQFAGAYAESRVMRGQGRIDEAQASFQASEMEIQARFAELQAEEILNQGDKQSREYQKRVNQIKGSQRASLAAQGIDVDVGTAADLQDETAEVGALDAMTIKNNAWRQAFGYKQESTAMQMQARLTRMSGRFQREQTREAARRTLITGGMRAATTLYEGAESAIMKAGSGGAGGAGGAG